MDIDAAEQSSRREAVTEPACDAEFGEAPDGSFRCALVAGHDGDHNDWGVDGGSRWTVTWSSAPAGRTKALADALCEALVLIDDYQAATGPIFTPPNLITDVRPVIHDAQAALKAVGAPSTKHHIRAQAQRLAAERALGQHLRAT